MTKHRKEMLKRAEYVVCVDDKIKRNKWSERKYDWDGGEVPRLKTLTEGNVYEVIHERHHRSGAPIMFVVDDRGHKRLASMGRFKPTSEVPLKKKVKLEDIGIKIDPNLKPYERYSPGLGQIHKFRGC